MPGADECAICLSPPHLPRTLPCGHTFCGGCGLRVLARAQSEGAASAPCPGCRAPFTAAALDVPSLRHDCRAIKRRRSWWVAPTERERELRLALDEHAAARRSLRLLEWPHWLRLWHFAAGMLLSLGVAAAALAYDHPALFDGEAMVSAIGATGRLLTPAQVAWQLLTSSTPFFDLALRLALDNSAVTAAAAAAASAATSTASAASAASAQATVAAKGGSSTAGSAAPRLETLSLGLSLPPSLNPKPDPKPKPSPAPSPTPSPNPIP